MKKVTKVNFSLMTMEEAFKLFYEIKKFSGATDSDLRDYLVMKNESLVYYLAKKYEVKGESIEDLTQVAFIGLINAIDRFDPTRGVKFLTYAWQTITGEILRHFRDKTDPLKIPRKLKELNKKIQNLIDENPEINQELSAIEIAEIFETTEEKVNDALKSFEAYKQISIYSKIYAANGKEASLEDFLGKEDTAIENLTDYAEIHSALDCLDAGCQKIIHLMIYYELTQDEISKIIKTSQMQVSRIKKMIFGCFKKAWNGEKINCNLCRHHRRQRKLIQTLLKNKTFY